MITQNILLDMATGKNQVNLKSNKVRDAADKNASDFNNIFSKSINSNQSMNKMKVGNEKSVNSFKQISRGKTIAFKNKDETYNTGPTESENIDLETEDTSKLKENSILNGISELMGVSKDELINLMAAIGIKPMDLCNAGTVTDALAKLSDALGLNKQQNQDLLAVVQNINSLVDSSIKQLSPKSNASEKEGWVRVQGVNIEVENIIKPELKELSSIIDGKVQALVNSIKSESGSSFDGIMQKMKQITMDGCLQKGISGLEAKNEKMNYGQSEDEKADSRSDDTDKNSASKTTISLKHSLADSLKPQESVNSDIQDTNLLNNLNVSEVTKAFDLNHPERISSEIKIAKNAIMSQVVEKAKVMLDGQKSEMIMELRPESLGKLALKVVTENGIVMAKFVAENHQVKEVIESNMQLLKDSLEKQGLAIQGFSVSVGQDSEKGYNDQYMYKGRSSIISDSGTDDALIVGIPFADEHMAMANPYLTTESSIDFRA